MLGPLPVCKRFISFSNHPNILKNYAMYAVTQADCLTAVFIALSGAHSKTIHGLSKDTKTNVMVIVLGTEERRHRVSDPNNYRKHQEFPWYFSLHIRLSTGKRNFFCSTFERLHSKLNLSALFTSSIYYKMVRHFCTTEKKMDSITREYSLCPFENHICGIKPWSLRQRSKNNYSNPP